MHVLGYIVVVVTVVSGLAVLAWRVGTHETEQERNSES